MPLDAAWYAGLIEGDGTPGSGTPWTKAEVGTFVGLINNVATWNNQSTSVTGTQTDFNLSKRKTVLYCNNASAVEFNGFAVNSVQPQEGDTVLIEALGPGSVKWLHQSGGTASFRGICPSVNGQIIGAGGRMLGVYDSPTARWRVTMIDPGKMIDVPYAGANFTGIDSMTWTVESGDQITFKYMQNGRMLFLNVTVFTSTVGGTPSNALQIAMPAGFVIDDSGGGQIIRILNNNTEEHGMIDFSAGGTLIRVYRPGIANWSAATNTTYIYLTTELEVQ